MNKRKLYVCLEYAIALRKHDIILVDDVPLLQGGMFAMASCDLPNQFPFLRYL
jgi:hypothetical protein